MAHKTSSTAFLNSFLPALLNSVIIGTVCSFGTPTPNKNDLPIVDFDKINGCIPLKKSNKQKTFNGHNFSDLPDDILEAILIRIDMCRDFVSFTTVCKSWRSIVHNFNARFPFNLQIYHFLPKKKALPLLLHPCGKDDKMPYLYSTVDRKIYGGLHIPELRNKQIFGCRNGWLVTIDKNNLQMNLLNPLTRIQISLPHVSTFQKSYKSDDKWRNKFTFVRRVYISSDPVLDQENCLIVAVVSKLCTLSFCRIGDDRWTKLEPSIIGNSDVIMYKGLLYAIEWTGILIEIQISPIVKITVVAKLALDEMGKTYYIVESTDCLLITVRREKNGKTTSFMVYEVVETQYPESGCYFVTEDFAVHTQKEHTQYTLREMHNLNGKMLYIGGYNQCHIFEPSLYPGSRKNCIYIEDNCDTGVYDIEHRITEFFPSIGNVSFGKPFVWFSPNPW